MCSEPIYIQRPPFTYYIINMPLFGKKSDKKPPSSPKDPKEEQKKPKVPTVEDKYIMKDVLGT